MAVELTVKHIPGVADPLDQNAPWYLLIELTSPNPRQNLMTLLTAALEDAAAGGTIMDAMFATPWRRPKPCGSCGIGAPRHSATMAQASSTMSPCGLAIPTLIAEGSALVRRLAPKETSYPTATPGTATCIST